MKFKVGDKVTIREDLSRHELNVVSDMEQYRGKVATITGVKGIDDYSIDLDDGWWHWDDSMFEEIKEEKEKFRAFLNEVARGDKSADNDKIRRPARYHQVEFTAFHGLSDRGSVQPRVEGGRQERRDTGYHRGIFRFVQISRAVRKV